MKVYTKTGDKGETSLIGGVRVAKNDLRIDAYGTIDELNSFVGLVRDVCPDEEQKQVLYNVQNTLFVIGSNLASAPESKMQIPDLQENEIEELERSIDKMEMVLEPLKNFVLPGGHQAVSHAHVARCVCRRAERNCVALQQQADIDHSIIPYLNRLSDYLFVLSRKMAKDLGAEEVLWKPLRS
ncbi:MAG: cob(I)yrinic acid a,c-diamide adenosyltransferase [Bacteroidetes bacterium]|nr:cob(I)yrinic acid a,c-diamide adenosyltransferase [Bacteroidota bacterium]